jgi:hypothetical protein
MVRAGGDLYCRCFFCLFLTEATSGDGEAMYSFLGGAEVRAGDDW